MLLDSDDSTALSKLRCVALVVDHLTLDENGVANLDDGSAWLVELLTVKAIAAINLEGSRRAVSIVGDEIGGISEASGRIDIGNRNNDTLGIDRA